MAIVVAFTDGIELRVRHGAPPIVEALLVGPSVVGHRLHPALGRTVEGVEHALAIEAGRPLRIAFGDVLSVDDHVKADVTFAETGASTVERWLRRWVGSIPGAS